MNAERNVPWYSVENRVFCGAPDCRMWCICECQFADDAASIVRAVNVLPACVAAMEAVEMYVLRWSRGCEMDPLEMDEQAETLAQLRTALAAAKEKQDSGIVRTARHKRDAPLDISAGILTDKPFGPNAAKDGAR